MRISDLGEFGLIDLVRQWTQPDQSATDAAAYRLTVANGDDAAALTFPAGPLTRLYTTDTMVAGVHFTAGTTPWRDLGWKAIASNISDVAAMGGEPEAALVTLGLPPDTPVAGVEQLYAGMMEICRQFGAQIIGGDMVRSPVAFITVALTGACSGSPMVRTVAQPGHVVAVTGPLGSSAGGLRQLLETGAGESIDESELVQQHRRPLPHVAAGQALAAAGVRSAMDVSDGLADDLAKLCAASGVSAEIYANKVPALSALKTAFPDDWLDLALYGGEDYVLLFTAPADIMDAAMTRLPPGGAVIGEVKAGEPGSVLVLDGQGSPRLRAGAGWDHFAA
ncbi:MAG: thiamine-phosphate kinase [Chloroflexi bacterium]|nr:thiamine-phosphate kinase [Chloroflexota bacterium]MYD46872.1 thiamine-phosphate kinase [Chloroflexota bacterium]